MPVWDDILTERDKQVYANAGYGRRSGFGERPAVLIVDVNYAFVGDKPEPILESIKSWRNSCGLEGWEGVRNIQRLLAAARSRDLPIVYTTGEQGREDGFDRGRWSGKNYRGRESVVREGVDGNAIPREIAPEPRDIIIRKKKPSGFFGTPLASYLIDLKVDTLLTCGTTTSGCVRATVIDGFSYNFNMVLVEECTFDRGQASHKINLFDMNAKYADVVSIDEVERYVLGLRADLFPQIAPSRELAPAR